MEGARVASSDDLDALSRLRQEGHATLAGGRGGPMWLRRELRHPADEATLAALLDDQDCRVLVGTIDDVPVAYAVAHRESVADGGSLAVVDELFVEPDARDVGVGEALLGDLLAWAQASGCLGIDAFALPGDRHTKNLFERSGLVARAILVHRTLGTPP